MRITNSVSGSGRQGKRKVEAQVEEKVGAAIMLDLMQALLANWI